MSLQTPGVYIQELNAFPNSVIPVPTAVPAFIGYTPQAIYDGKLYTNIPQKITSFAEFLAIYGLPNPQAPAPVAKQYAPQYYLVAQKNEPVNSGYIVIDGAFYAILPDPNTIYYLYNSVKLFYENGGGDAYIVSVGGYGTPSEASLPSDGEIINQNVKLSDLISGLGLLQNEQEPTLYICPEATLLSVTDYAILMQEMLLQCSNMQTAISIFDIIGGKYPDPVLYTNDIQTFRAGTGTAALCYGAAYYPFIGTTVMQQADIDYTNFFGGDVKQLEALLNPASDIDPNIVDIINNILNTGSGMTVTQNNNALLEASKTYSEIIQRTLSDANALPPSGAIAGIMTKKDNEAGVWEAPANVSIVGAVSLPINLSDSQQSGLSTDVVTGKSINVIRDFNGIGIVVWGARTLDGNNPDWKYLSVRRTITYLQQSCMLAARAYVFEPNDKNTWEAVKATISSFLTNTWKQGGLLGATAADAFAVQCGLGTTMTADDLLKGNLIISVSVSVTHPAEFIVFTFQQEMAAPG